MGRTEDSAKSVWLRAWPACVAPWRSPDESEKPLGRGDAG